MFSVKDPIPCELRASVVYDKFLCAGCNACYIGENFFPHATVSTLLLMGPLTHLNIYKISITAALYVLMIVLVS